MPVTFPTALFAFDEQEIDIERRSLSGGTALSGEEDTIQIDGGGRWFAEFANGPLLEREHTLAWRAITALLEEGATQIIVPFCDPLHQPYGNEHDAPHSDGTPFSDDTIYSGGGPVASMAAAAALRATTLNLAITLAQPLIGGEHLSIEHPTKGWRAYRVVTIPEQTETTATVTVRPPLREAVTAGEVVDFANPRCLMVQQGRASTKTEIGLYGEAAIRFVEAP